MLRQRILRPLMHRLFERRLAVDTADKIEFDDLGYTDGRNIYYEPAEWRTLQRVLPRRSVSRDDVFIDLGSGKARMVIRAAQYPFKRVIGVELSDGLHEVAQRNVEASRGRLACKDIRLVQANALDYELPDEVTVVFLNNPFLGEVFDAAIESILRSMDRRLRALRIIYRNPVEHERLMATGRVRLDKEWQRGASSGRRRGVVIRRYLVLPAPR